MAKVMDAETYKWLLAKQEDVSSFSEDIFEREEDIIGALVTCALELERAACLSSSLRWAAHRHDAAHLIVLAIRLLEDKDEKPDNDGVNG